MRGLLPAKRNFRCLTSSFTIKSLRSSLLSRRSFHSLDRCLAPEISAITECPNHDFFRYTSGRWVWDEERQLRERFRKFNISELQRTVVKSVSAKSCLSMEKLGEGTFNKAFKLEMDDGRVIVARIPNPNAGPSYCTTASEVATMDFVRTQSTTCRLRELMSQSHSAENSTGCPSAKSLCLERDNGQSCGVRIYHHGVCTWNKLRWCLENYGAWKQDGSHR